jgi:hypothetical protein
LYQSLVDSTLRFLIEQVGQVEGTYAEANQLPADFLLRRTAGNGLELIGLATIHASPVWMLAALADISGAGRSLIREISKTLVADGILEGGVEFDSAEQLLEGLERTSARLAEGVNTPPLNLKQLRTELTHIREEAKLLAPPSPQELWRIWQSLELEAGAQGRPVWELSSVIALSAIRTLATQTVGTLLTHYRDTIGEIHQTGYGRYLLRELSPYLRAATQQFSPKRVSLTQRVLKRWSP